MNPRTLTTVVIALIVGFSGGWLAGSRRTPPASRDRVAAAEAALEELLAYRGTGAQAARKTIDLADEIVGGGPAMVPKLDAALGRVNFRHRFTSHGDQAPGILEIDTRFGILSRHTNAGAVILEALDRIGGDEVAPILMREAELQGRVVPAVHRVAAVLFLAHRGDRADVREFFGRIVNKLLVLQRTDWESRLVLQITRTHLDMALWDRLSASLTSGWADREMQDEIARSLVTLDEARAADLFLSMVASVTTPRTARQAAARAIARMPEHRAAATDLLVRDADLFVVNQFIDGLRHGRWEEYEVYRDVLASGDRDEMRAYDRERLPRLKEILVLLGRLEEALGPEAAGKILIPKRKAEFGEIVGRVEAALAAEEKEREEGTEKEDE